MTFKAYPYERVDIDEVKASFATYLEQMTKAKKFDVFDQAMQALYFVRNKVETMLAIVSIRFSLNVEDVFYAQENAFCDQVGPILEGLVNQFYQVLLDSPFKQEIVDKYGQHLIRLADIKLKTFSDEVLEDLQTENELVTAYGKLVGRAKIEFRGQTYNLSTMTPFIQSEEREIRKEAQEAVTRFFENNEVKFDQLYDDLVQLRHKIARKLDFDSYVELAYAQLARTDYGQEDVAIFREQVAEYIVPLRVEYNKRQAKRLGLATLKYYDKPLKFTGGNAIPAGDENWMREKASNMYRQLSKETDEFFKFMIEKGLLDLSSRDGKQPGGYCDYLSTYQAPFIFANFNGTEQDVEILTHEAGHAFQVYSSRHQWVTEYQWPTLEACEIHSMSMEYLTYPWMKDFFEEDVDKFIYNHLSQPVDFIPYGVTVDEFQHWVYQHVEATPEERKKQWVVISNKYMPDTDYEGNDFLQRGGFWFRQGHIFRRPFYYIDYTLALTCAVQFYIKATENRTLAWQDYLRLCKQGGSHPFLELVQIANLRSPFEKGIVKDMMDQVWTSLLAIDDAKL